MKLNSRDAQVCHRVWEWGEWGRGKQGGWYDGGGEETAEKPVTTLPVSTLTIQRCRRCVLAKNRNSVGKRRLR